MGNLSDEEMLVELQVLLGRPTRVEMKLRVAYKLDDHAERARAAGRLF